MISLSLLYWLMIVQSLFTTLLHDAMSQLPILHSGAVRASDWWVPNIFSHIYTLLPPTPKHTHVELPIYLSSNYKLYTLPKICLLIIDAKVLKVSHSIPFFWTSIQKIDGFENPSPRNDGFGRTHRTHADGATDNVKSSENYTLIWTLS